MPQKPGGLLRSRRPPGGYRHRSGAAPMAWGGWFAHPEPAPQSRPGWTAGKGAPHPVRGAVGGLTKLAGRQDRRRRDSHFTQTFCAARSPFSRQDCQARALLGMRIVANSVPCRRAGPAATVAGQLGGPERPTRVGQRAGQVRRGGDLLPGRWEWPVRAISPKWSPGPRWEQARCTASVARPPR